MLIKFFKVLVDYRRYPRVLLNGKEAKPAKEVKVGDEIEIVYGVSRLKVKVTAVAEVTKKQDASDLYEVID